MKAVQQHRIKTVLSNYIHRIIESLRLEKLLRSSSPTTSPSPLCPLTMSLGATSPRSWNSSRDSDSITSLCSLCQCITTLSQNKLFLTSNLNLPQCNLRPSPLVLSPGRRGQPPPHYNLPSGSCREWYGHHWASSSPVWTIPAPSATPHKTCASDPSPALLPFSEHLHLFFICIYIIPSLLLVWDPCFRVVKV